jgi:hypothetical protein
MASEPAFVRFVSPFWFGLEGYLDELAEVEIEIDDAGRQILVSAPAPSADVPYVGVVHSGSVLPVVAVDTASSTVTVRLPAPWNQNQEGLPLDPDVVVVVDEQGDAPQIEEVSVERARELFPDDFRPLTQEDLDRWAAEES